MKLRLVNLTIHFSFAGTSCGITILSIAETVAEQSTIPTCQTPKWLLQLLWLQVEAFLIHMSVKPLPVFEPLSPYMFHHPPLAPVRELALSYSSEAYIIGHQSQCLLNKVYSSSRHIFLLEFMFLYGVRHIYQVISQNPEYDLKYIPLGKR